MRIITKRRLLRADLAGLLRLARFLGFPKPICLCDECRESLARHVAEACNQERAT